MSLFRTAVPSRRAGSSRAVSVSLLPLRRGRCRTWIRLMPSPPLVNGVHPEFEARDAADHVVQRHGRGADQTVRVMIGLSRANRPPLVSGGVIGRRRSRAAGAVIALAVAGVTLSLSGFAGRDAGPGAISPPARSAEAEREDLRSSGGPTERQTEAIRSSVAPAEAKPRTDAAPRAQDPEATMSGGEPRGARGPRPQDRVSPARRDALLVRIPSDLPIMSRPGGGRQVGTMPAGSRYLRTPTTAWVLKVSADGRYGKVTVPYSRTQATGWIRIRGLERISTPYRVRVSLSRHLVVVTRRGEPIMRLRAATGAPTSPTPPGRYFVTDRVAFDPGGPYGAFAFGISGIQTRLPAGWTAGDQLAIHGTNDPASIGTPASAGCLRVSRKALESLMPVLELGTPVVIHP